MKKYLANIASVENGYLVEVGCKHFVFEKREELIKELDAYLSGKLTKLTEKYEKEARIGEDCAAEIACNPQMPPRPLEERVLR